VVSAFSTVIAPSPPTFSMASATGSPMAGSLWAEIVAIWAFSVVYDAPGEHSCVSWCRASGSGPQSVLRNEVVQIAETSARKA
jgi:hypothetical protein